MPRTPLGEIDPNGRRRNELSVSLRNRICGARDAGKDIAQIAQMYKTPKSTIRDTLKLNSLRKDGQSLPRSGAPTKITAALERKILRFIRRAPKATYPLV
jgi:transposase